MVSGENGGAQGGSENLEAIFNRKASPVHGFWRGHRVDGLPRRHTWLVPERPGSAPGASSKLNDASQLQRSNPWKSRAIERCK